MAQVHRPEPTQDRAVALTLPTTPPGAECITGSVRTCCNISRVSSAAITYAKDSLNPLEFGADQLGHVGRRRRQGQEVLIPSNSGLISWAGYSHC